MTCAIYMCAGHVFSCSLSVLQSSFSMLIVGFNSLFIDMLETVPLVPVLLLTDSSVAARVLGGVLSLLGGVLSTLSWEVRGGEVGTMAVFIRSMIASTSCVG